MKKDIESRIEIELLVNTFYSKVREDDLLGPIFNGIIGDNWDKHLDKMYRFWETVLLEQHSYMGSPFAPHAKMPLEEKHFVRWIKYFHETLDEHFEGEKCSEARWRSTKMAQMFMYKIQDIKNNQINIL